jgi:hypothetical protein
MDVSHLSDENSYRFVVVLNKKVETGKLMNALGHMTAGLAGKVCQQDMQFLEYRDKNGGSHPGISHFPFIVLVAENSNKIRTARKEAIARGIPFTDFTSTMTIGRSQQQLDATEATLEAELEYFGLCLFAKTEVLKEFTGKFSLFK